MARSRNSGRKKARLVIDDVPVEVIDGIAAMGQAMTPPVRRNDLLRHYLAEIAAGRFQLIAVEADERRAA